MNDVRELLGRAAEHAGQPVISTEVVYARAARVRWRRRATVAAAAFAVVAAGAVAVPGLGSQTKQEQNASVGAPAESVGNGGRAKQLVELLPTGVGSIEQVSLAVIIKHATAAQAEEHPVGPLDGQYSVRRDGGVGYLVVDVRTGKQVRQKSGGVDPAANLCEPTNGEPRPAQCVREVLPDGRILTIWSDPMKYGGTPLWGPELVARLTLKDGGLLSVRDSTGLKSEQAQGPLLKSPPLTRAQLRTLMLSPELSAK
ncbi:hypothetical protein OG830_25960 [Streptomyces sp. NBC_00121]|uniref:hypothetical protein n=1 Tax=unclassified Streptomyces TaxID=2593676 RepID=UPI002DDA300C|nr:hypothetical protein [Streptomyces sp. NBC_01760]WSC71617.1 hypothetical protein OG807_25865 [Streptomyces sp. NBC_01760]